MERVHGLLHGVGVVGHDESERREEQRQQHSKHVDEPHGTSRCDAINEPRQQQAHGDDKQRDEPVRDEFGEDERPLGNGRNVNLFDGTCLLLTNDVECGQKTLICSMVPASFSPTMLSVGRKPVISIITMAKRAGIMKSL